MLRNGIVLGNSSHVGQVRTENQDYFGYFEPEDDEGFRRLGRLVIVADGMGGEAGGYTASRLAVDVIRETYFATPRDARVQDSLRLALEAANEAVYRRGQDDPDCRGMGTTAVVVALFDEVAFVAHVGDSRAYLVREGEISQLTEDHTMVNRLVKAGTITPEEAREHPDANVITRSIGSKAHVEVDVSESIAVAQGDRFILCTDGLYGLVDDHEIAGTVMSVSPMEACSALVALANQRGGHDNVTVQIVLIGAWSEPAMPVKASSPRAPRTVPPRSTPKPQKLGLLLALVLGVVALACVAGIWLWSDWTPATSNTGEADAASGTRDDADARVQHDGDVGAAPADGRPPDEMDEGPREGEATRPADSRLPSPPETSSAQPDQPAAAQGQRVSRPVQPAPQSAQAVTPPDQPSAP